MRRPWLIFIAIFVASFAILGWVGSEIFRQSPPIPREVVTTDGQTMVAAGEVSDGQNVWQAMGGMQVGSIWGYGSYVAPDWTADYLHRKALFILDGWAKAEFAQSYKALGSEHQSMLRQRLQERHARLGVDALLFACDAAGSALAGTLAPVRVLGDQHRHDDGDPAEPAADRPVACLLYTSDAADE